MILYILTLMSHIQSSRGYIIKEFNYMNYGLILAGGVGQRMRRSGMHKQFLEVYGKPIII